MNDRYYAISYSDKSTSPGAALSADRQADGWSLSFVSPKESNPRKGDPGLPRRQAASSQAVYPR
ncbi:MAG: hypothetical protein PHP85_04090 [Gallionella sp.]|nr:hypothetical protein [Gallionella sp.]